MDALRMVWTISRHYNTDDRMTPLMERIAHVIASRVKHAVSIRAVLRMPSADALTLLREAKGVLERWESTYQVVRAKIEDRNDNNRWEFDRTRLFQRTGYMAAVCGDLLEIVEKVDEFRQILCNPELKCTWV
jgi:dynein heavy chain